MESSEQQLTEFCDRTDPYDRGPGGLVAEMAPADVDAALLKLMNQARAQRNVAPLKQHPALLRAATAHAQDQADHNQISHYGLRDGSTWADRCRAAGYKGADLTTIGENVAAGQTSPEMAMSDWMQSPGHRDAILNPRFVHAASAVAVGSRGWSYWCTDFGFGAPDAAPEPAPAPPPTDLDYMLV